MTKIVRSAEFFGDVLTISTDLPERGAGVSTEEIARVFKSEVMDLIARYRDRLRGASVRLSGRNILANGAFAGFAFAKAGAHRIEQEQQGGEWVTVAAHDDPDAPIPITWEPGMVVRARLFGHEAEVVIIGVGTGYRGSRRVQVKAGRQSAWMDEDDVLEFIRYQD